MGNRIRKEARSEKKFEERSRRDGCSGVTGGTTGPRSRRSEFRVFPKPTGCGGTAGVVNPVIRKEERSANRGEKSRRKNHQNWGRFTNTAVPNFEGDGCWQQHLQIFNAIAKSNGWADETAALQLFAHLEGLNVALLMPEGGGGQPGGIFAGSLELLLFTGKVGGVQKKIRECNSPNRSESCHGDFSGPGEIWILAPKTGCSGTGLLRTNGVVGRDVT